MGTIQFYTWLIETTRVNKLHLTHINTNPDQKGESYYVHLVFSTRAHAMMAKALFHHNFGEMSLRGPNRYGLVCYPMKDAKLRKMDGWWE